MNGLPTKNHALIITEYNNNLVRAILGLKTGEREIRNLKDQEVLIKMEAAPCNPSDIAFLRGGYNIKRNLPAVPGFEGAGKVVATGNEVKHLIGKRVSSFTQADTDGTWGEYFISQAEDCIIIKEEIDFEQAAAFSINPFTAFGLIELAVQNKCNAIIQNAGGGQIAEFIRTLAELHGLEVINIVRKKEQVIKLKAKGVSHVLESSKENFKEELTKVACQLNATFAFDAVGGEQTGILINALPPHASIVLYGGLAGGFVSAIEPFDIIFRDKKLLGFNLTDWKKTKTNEEFEKINNHLQNLLIEGKIRTKIQASFQLENAIDGLRTYIKSMSEGKVLFKP
jgi:NADPH:quinone reductase